jgi:hypothetical protein
MASAVSTRNTEELHLRAKVTKKKKSTLFGFQKNNSLILFIGPYVSRFDMKLETNKADEIRDK